MSEVRFIRVNGRVVPVRGKGQSSKPASDSTKNKRQTVYIKSVSSKVKTGERAVAGFKAGAVIGGIFGGTLNALESAANGNSLKVGAFKAAIGATAGAVNTGIIGAGANAIFGARTKNQLYIGKKKSK